MHLAEAFALTHGVILNIPAAILIFNHLPILRLVQPTRIPLLTSSGRRLLSGSAE